MASPSKKTADEPGETWTADRLTRLETLSLAGETAQAIAQQLGVSRSAVMGKLFRLGRVSGMQRFRLKRGKKRRKIRNKKRGKSLLELTDKCCR
jgi:hypothetical protein